MLPILSDKIVSNSLGAIIRGRNRSVVLPKSRPKMIWNHPRQCFQPLKSSKKLEETLLFLTEKLRKSIENRSSTSSRENYGSFRWLSGVLLYKTKIVPATHRKNVSFPNFKCCFQEIVRSFWSWSFPFRMVRYGCINTMIRVKHVSEFLLILDIKNVLLNIRLWIDTRPEPSRVESDVF